MPTNKKTPDQLRSARWFAPDDLRSFGHRSRAMQQGYAPEEWKGRPVIAILNTWSDAQPCHMHFKSRVDDVKRGILMAGGLPLELPALSLSESLLKPTTMLYRNLLAMDAEELLRSHPVDGVVLMGGCDKTTPALLLGATSMNIPADRSPGCSSRSHPAAAPEWSCRSRPSAPRHRPDGCAAAPRRPSPADCDRASVSYTHLTLPTNREV